MSEEVENNLSLEAESENKNGYRGCYCGEKKNSETMECKSCHRHLHSDCLKSGRPSPLAGDVYFEVTCSDCASDGEENSKRAYVSWTQAVYLALYNLAIHSSGRKGYFRWKEDICQFIERNWMLLFPGRKRTNSWCSTVAGTLSVGCPHYYKSGMKEFKENGWWALTDKVPPVVKLGNPGSEHKRKKNSNKFSKKRKAPVSNEVSEIRSQNAEVERECKDGNDISKEGDNDNLLESLLSSDTVTMDTESDEVIASLLSEEELQNLGGVTSSPFPFMELDDPCSFISDEIKEKLDGSHNDGEVDEGQNDSGESDKAESVASTVKSDAKKSSKIKQSSEEDIAAETTENRLTLISEEDEHEILCRLNACTESIQNDCTARRLRRKLMLRKVKRENGLPLFDLDKYIKTSLSSTKCYVYKEGDFVPLKNDENTKESEDKKSEQDGYQKRSSVFTRYSRVLDRFLAAPQMMRRKDQQNPTFLSRLVGADKQTLFRPITSPYTARVLKPFIRRDFESNPLKLRLLQEIKAYPHRDDSTWQPSTSHPIDYCYVQPYHIPAVNTMCREFFWPGIDLSESLQYPDFSCVVLYRSLVIGFAFMVPDVKYNEAYISFILVHPEWRRAGIGSYMLYHLIQTCMGKDVTLHVSVTNQAMLMYQKFGFKPEEFILDFYEKYLPESSQECRHAFFLRLRR